MNHLKRTWRYLLFAAVALLSSRAYGQGSIPLGETVYYDCNTFDPTTGAPTAADSTPVQRVYEEATDAAIINGTSLTARAGHTGEYRGTFVASSGNGFEVGRWYIVKCYATVSAIDGIFTAMHFRITAAEPTEGTSPVDVELYRNAVPNVLISGREDVSVGAMVANVVTAAVADPSVVTKIQTGLRVIPKNVAFSNYYFKLRNSDGSAYTLGTSANINCTRSLDGAALASCAGTTTASIAHVGQGTYKMTLAASDVNADSEWLRLAGPNCVMTALNCWEEYIKPQR